MNVVHTEHLDTRPQKHCVSRTSYAKNVDTFRAHASFFPFFKHWHI